MSTTTEALKERVDSLACLYREAKTTCAVAYGRLEEAERCLLLAEEAEENDAEEGANDDKEESLQSQ